MSISLLWEDLYLIKKLQLIWLRYYTDNRLKKNDHKLINLNNCAA